MQALPTNGQCPIRDSVILQTGWERKCSNKKKVACIAVVSALHGLRDEEPSTINFYDLYA